MDEMYDYSLCIDLVEDDGFVYTIETSPSNVAYWLDIIGQAVSRAGVTIRSINL